MDSVADLPAVTADSDAQPADPTPPLSSNGGAHPPESHPPYAEMIAAAIVALKDKDGSSRQAIAKYIEKEYPNLPSTHSSLLTHHLKRLKNEGQLMMVKHSYMLPPPRSVPFQDPTPTMDDYSVTANDTFATINSSVQPRRKPGRPPKPRHDFGFQVQPDGQQAVDLPPYQPQFEYHSQTQLGQDLQSHYGSGQESQGNYAGAAEPIFVSLGLADDGVAPPPENAVVSPKRGRGRPPKGRSVVASSGGGNVEVEKRGRRCKPGRPKLMSIAMVNGGVVKRARGRPKRMGGPVTVPLSGNVVRPRGRPKRAVSMPRPADSTAPDVFASNGDGESGAVSRRRGRPPKNSGDANKVRQSTSQQLSKVGQGTAVLVTDPQQLVAFQELNSKYEHLQLKAKEVLNAVRPYVSSDYAVFGALQELEKLVEVEANGASNVGSKKVTFV